MTNGGAEDGEGRGWVKGEVVGEEDTVDEQAGRW